MNQRNFIKMTAINKESENRRFLLLSKYYPIQNLKSQSKWVRESNLPVRMKRKSEIECKVLELLYKNGTVNDITIYRTKYNLNGNAMTSYRYMRNAIDTIEILEGLSLNI